MKHFMQQCRPALLQQVIQQSIHLSQQFMQQFMQQLMQQFTQQLMQQLIQHLFHSFAYDVAIFGHNRPKTGPKRSHHPKRFKNTYRTGLPSSFQGKRFYLKPLPHLRVTPKMAQKCSALASTSHKPRFCQTLGYVAWNPIPRAHGPPANPHFFWFPNLRMAQTDT